MIFTNIAKIKNNFTNFVTSTPKVSKVFVYLHKIRG